MLRGIILKSEATKHLSASLFVTLSISAACAADPSEEMAALMADGLIKYAVVAGKVDSCTLGKSERIAELAERIAAWRYPGWWDGLWGTRSDYARNIGDPATVEYLLTVSQPCPGLPGMYQTLAEQWVRQIEQETENAK